MIELRNVTYSYKKGNNVLSNISFDLEPGSIYGLMGKNGIGKSTLLKILSGLLKPEGKCLVDDYNPFKREKDFFKKIILLSETPYAPMLKVEAFAKNIAPFYPNFDNVLFQKCLNEFDVPKNTLLTSMSLGQQKKALISITLACKTPIILMDEPTNGLDIPSKSIFRKIISSEINDDRMIVISTHQVKDLENLINHVIILDTEGVIVNSSVNEIEDKLFFGEIDKNDKLLYFEESVRGCYGVRLNQGDEISNVDFEMLFNSAVSNQKLFQENLCKHLIEADDLNKKSNIK
ncbi:MAG: ABC transporter ATP-binding protein [Bacteroidales bacterium]|nr:ABC transporter ATP-binding protein [Bacteroidales bacterium]